MLTGRLNTHTVAECLRTMAMVLDCLVDIHFEVRQLQYIFKVGTIRELTSIV
jgi:hypothetical protein